MALMTILLLGLTIVLGVITSFTDIREGKIRNRHLLIVVGMGLLIYMYTFFIVDNNRFFLETLTNFIFAVLLGFFMWRINIWTAGDGKLFSVYALLVPISVYVFGQMKTGFLNFSSFNLLINTFIPMFIVLFVISLIKNKEKFLAFKRAFSPMIIITIALFIFSFSWIFGILFGYAGLNSNYVLSLILILILFTMIEKMVNMKYILFGLVLIRLFFDDSWGNVGYFLGFFGQMVVFILFRYFAIDIGFSSFSKKVKVKDLKEGMVIGDVIQTNEDGLEIKSIIFFSIRDYINNKDFRTEGLTKNDIVRLKKQVKPSTEITILQTVPFAPYMFIGVILTVLFKGNIIMAIF